MPLGTLPMIAWGSPENLSTFANGGTPTVVSGVADPFGGTSAYTIGDDNAALQEYKSKTVVLQQDGMVTLGFFAKASTAGQSEVLIGDNTAGVVRAEHRNTWTAGVPTASIVAGSGTAYPPIAVGNSWYYCLFTANNCIADNDNHVQYSGTLMTSAAATGATSYYLRHVVLLDLLDEAVSFERGRDGSDYVQGPSGVEDAWEIIEQVLRARIRWVPQVIRSSPVLVSGWFGEGESAGVNDGIKAMLRAGRQKTQLLFVPNRATPTVYQACYLAEPLKDAPGLEANGYDRSIAIELRGDQVFVGV